MAGKIRERRYERGERVRRERDRSVGGGVRGVGEGLEKERISGGEWVKREGSERRTVRRGGAVTGSKQILHRQKQKEKKLKKEFKYWVLSILYMQ